MTSSWGRCLCVYVAIALLTLTQAQNIDTCEDTNANTCRVIRSHHCYDFRVRQTCCATCTRFRGPDESCQYGDRYKVWVTEIGRFTCQSFISYFGSYKCFRNAEFRRTCCSTCGLYDR